jgi:tetratricopeptide (TPR) repeat protein
MPKRPASTSSSPTAADLAPNDLLTWPVGWVCALIFAIAFAIYFPALNGGLLWDDPSHVTRPELRSLAGLFRIWFEPGATQQYYPLLHSAFWVEARLWGDATLGYHLVNVVFHATAACLLGVLLRRLAVPGAWLAALIFVVHPVCVESVAWISEQKNTLSLVLYLCAALAYLRFDTSRRAPAYLFASGLFLLALLTKTVTATLPAALLVIFWWRRGRLNLRRDVLPLLPWFALSAAFAVVTARIEATFVIGAEQSHYALTFLERGLLAGRVIWFYLSKLLWPANLIFIYPRWQIDAGAAWQYLLPLAVLGALAGLWFARRRALLAAALFFCGSLFPALGFIDIYPFVYSFVADHFQYLASLGVFAASGAGLALGLVRWPRATRAICIVVLLGLAGLSWKQGRMYRDVVTLYETTLQQNPSCWMAHNNLGATLLIAGRPQGAISHFDATLRLNPQYAEAESNWGDALRQIGQPREALAHYERAFALQPNFAETHNGWGIALVALGRSEEALPHFITAVRLKPNFPSAQFNAGLGLAKAGKVAEAIPHFQAAVESKPDYAEAELSWGMALAQTQRFPEAVAHFEQALRLDPKSARFQLTYARALAVAGRHGDAIAHYQAALEREPNSPEAHYGLAISLRETGRIDEAQRHLAAAQQLGRR